MKWFKHMSDMSQDVRVKRLVRKYGIEGYGLYNYIIELIVRRLDTDSPIPDLEESSQDIASDMKMDTVKVEEIIWFCITEGLLSQDELSGRVLAHKIYKFLQQSETRSEKIRKMIAEYKNGTFDSGHDCLRQSETNVKNRKEENRLDKTREEETVQEPTPPPTTEAPQSTELVSSAPTALAPKKLAPMKDDYAQAWQDALTARQPDSTWSNYGKERKALVTLGQRTRQLMEQTPYQNAGELIESVIRTFSDIRQTAKDGYWKNAPMTPSAVLTRWAEIWAKLSTRTAHQDDPHMQAVWAEILSDMEGNI